MAEYMTLVLDVYLRHVYFSKTLEALGSTGLYPVYSTGLYPVYSTGLYIPSL